MSAMRATYATFILAGVGFASWASRIPQIRDQLGLDAAQLGLVLLAVAAGSILALTMSSMLIDRYGSGRVVMVSSPILALTLVGVGIGSHIGVVPVVVALFLLGLSNGAWDVAMNVQAAAVERTLRRSIMSRFHAGFSVGTVAGALVGALMIALDVSVGVHLSLVAVIAGTAVPLAARSFGPDTEEAAHDEPAGPVVRSPLAAWREPRTLLIGVFVLAFAFTEGAANDWISVALIDGYDASAALGALAFVAFLTSMTLARWFGAGLLDRYGRVVVVRILCLIALAGVLLFVLGGSTELAFAGALLWGLGASLGFPVGMSAGADDPRFAAGRVSVIASIGYCAFLGGPPLVGFLGHEEGVLHALLVVAVLLAVAFLVAGALRPLRSAARSLTGG